MTKKADAAWDQMRQIFNDKPEQWDFANEQEKLDWLAKRYKEFHEVQKKLEKELMPD